MIPLFSFGAGVPLHGERAQRRITAAILAAAVALYGQAARADALQDYAQQCDAAIGATVPDFDCDAGTEVPGQGNVFGGNGVHSILNNGTACAEPNRLDRVCDPGSRFQVLVRSNSAYVVAHCRKENGDSGEYGDIAVIQYNRNNGATCFYQTLSGDQTHGNMPGGSSSPGASAGDKPVKAPSKGQSAWPWLTPSGTANLRCGGCHDNGPFIRSPYLNQVQGPNALPGSDDFNFNSDQKTPYTFVGQDFASWKAFKVEVGGNECNTCHRLGVNNVASGEGTALDFGNRATSASEESKNPTSPIWMPPIPVQVTFNQAHADSAKAIHDCAVRLHENPLPNTDACRITQFAGAWQPPPQCNISFFWTQATGGPPNFTVQCQQPADFFFVYGGNVPPASHFLGNNVLYSDLAENYNVFILACASQSATNPGPGEASCATFSIDKGPPDWCPAPHGPFVRFPQCCRACVDAGGFCHHDTRTGGCICE